MAERRLFRRTPPAPERSTAIVAAAKRIDLTDRDVVKSISKRRDKWQEQAWTFYDEVGEVKYAGNFVGNALAKLHLFVGVRDNPEEDPTPVVRESARPVEDDTGDVVYAPDIVLDALEELREPVGGFGEMLRLIGLNLDVAGECYLVGREDEPDEEEQEGIQPITRERATVWTVHSVDELKVQGDDVYLTDGTTGGAAVDDKNKLDRDSAIVVRIWLKHPRYSAKADSPLRGVLAQCEELLMIERTVRAVARSRLSAGMLLVPEELTFLPLDPTQVNAEDNERDPFIEELFRTLTKPIEDEGDASGQVPFVIRGPGEHLDKVKRVDLARDFEDVFDQRTDRALQRLAQGLNVPPEVVRGLADVNHWTAWQIEESTFKVSLEPRAVVVCEALTVGYLHPLLAEAGIPEPERYVVWFDATRLVVRPNRVQDAKDAFDKLLINDATARDALGFPEDTAPSDEEIARRLAIQRGPIDPALMNTLLGMLLAGAGTTSNGNGSQPPPAEQPEPIPEQPEGEDVPALAAAGDLPDDLTFLGVRAQKIDRDLRARLEGATDAAMRRAMELAGARARSKSKRNDAAFAAIRNVTNDNVLKTLGPAIVASLGMDERDLLQDAFKTLERQFHTWVAAAQASALSLVPALTEHERTALQQQQLEDRIGAWQWFHEALIERAQELVYAQDTPDVTDRDLLVPYSVVREAVARAGGADRADARPLAAR